jgi:hypothetical protein
MSYGIKIYTQIFNAKYVYNDFLNLHSLKMNLRSGRKGEDPNTYGVGEESELVTTLPQVAFVSLFLIEVLVGRE